MSVNPFKDSNLNDLQQNILDFFRLHYGETLTKVKDLWSRFMTKGKERITVMFIPHSEKRIINFHVSIFTITLIFGLLVVTVVITSTMIVNHTSTIKEVSKLKKYGSNSRVQIQKYKEEINKLYAIFQQFKPEITHLYSLTPGSDIDSLWAKGGAANPTAGMVGTDEISPPLEVLNIQEVERELKTTKQILAKVKSFLDYRKKIIENTPSIWPADGHIISRYGKRSSPYTFKSEFHRGIDIESFPGAEIRSTAPGKVKIISWDTILGLTISIEHKYGFTTSYSHCQRVSVEIGQKISKGEVLGYVGRTGKTTRYICYYQVKIGTDYVDPMPYLNRISKTDYAKLEKLEKNGSLDGVKKE
ncbi:MAG: M23 family metallopeptidase [bacterium]|nr:M23 family metallopeptidase [bacterium]